MAGPSGPASSPRSDNWRPGCHFRGDLSLTLPEAPSILVASQARLGIPWFELPATAGPRGPAPAHVAPMPTHFSPVELHMFRQILSMFTKSHTEAGMAADFFIGESLVGDGNEVAHIDLIIGSKSGPPAPRSPRRSDATTTASPRSSPSSRRTFPASPTPLLFNKVTIKGAKQAVQMFGPAQAAVARAVMDSVSEGVITKTRPTTSASWSACSSTGRPRTTRRSSSSTTRRRRNRSRARCRQADRGRRARQYKAARHPFASGAEG